MIKIKIEATDGIDLRKQLLDLLGGSIPGSISITGEQLGKLAIPVTRGSDAPEAPKMEVVKEAPAEKTTKKLTKKEQDKLDAEANKTATEAETGNDDTPPAEEEVKEEKAEGEIDFETDNDFFEKLRSMTLAMGRAERKDEVLGILKKFDAPKLTEMDAKHRKAYHDVILPLYEGLSDEIKAEFKI